MNQEPLPTEHCEKICEAAGCNAKATNSVTVKAGHYGIIGLNVCGNCVSKFEEDV